MWASGAAKRDSRAASTTRPMSFTKISTAEVTSSKAPRAMRGPRSPSIHEEAEPLRRISSVVSSGRPCFCASARPSAAATMCTPHNSWLMTFICAPAPFCSPKWKIRAPNVESTGRARSSAAAGPPTITVSVPFWAPTMPPVTGASSRWIPSSPRRVPSVRTYDGGSVLHATRIEPLRSARASPKPPNSTSSVCLSSTTKLTTMSARAASSAASSGTSPPRSRSQCSAAGFTSNPATAKPFASRLSATPRPIAPKPTRPIISVAMLSPLCRLQPGLDRTRDRLGRDAVAVVQSGQRAAARLAAPWRGEWIRR